MKIKGLDKYDIVWENGRVKVWSLYRRRWLSPLNGTAPGFHLMMDKKPRHLSPGFLRFLMLHPEIDPRDIDPVRERVKFAPDGTVLDLWSEPRKGRYSLFAGVDDALATVILMKAVSRGDRAYLYRWIDQARENAAWTVARLLKTTARKVSEHLEEGEKLFISQVCTARCETVIPLYAWFCRCIKSVMLSRRKAVSIEAAGLDKKRILSTDPAY